ncbi:MAG: MFS transporter [Actinomycetota bacterium]|nr:MFS transporter [Actinomycetota bacterium]
MVQSSRKNPGATPPHGGADRPEAFERDGPTALSYGALGAYAFCLYAFGPALALLRQELHFSYSLLGVHTSLWAGGAALVGITFAWACRRVGRRLVLWWSALGTAAGAALLATAHAVALTLLAAALLGTAGTMLQTATQSVLADRHGPRSERALVESNIGAGLCAVVAPLAIGVLHATPAGWRSAMVLPVLALAALYLTFRRQPLPLPQPLPQEPRGTGRIAKPSRLSLGYWLLAVLVAVGIGAEFCIVYFGAELLATTTGLTTTHAAAAMAVFYVGILLGRVVGGVLTRQAGRTSALIWLSLAVTMAGFVAFWLSGDVTVALLGLLVTGVGVANLFPLSLALALAAAPGRTDIANARTQLLGGALVIAAPLLLGTLADHLGLTAAFAVEPFLIALSALLLLAGRRAQGR